MPTPLPAAAARAAPNVRSAAAEDVFYPCSDGRPMADNMWQARAILNAAGDVEAAHPQALVAADILVYPEEGNNKNGIAPDVLVAFGVGTHSRSSYFVWREGKPPDWVLEVASPSTQAKDRDLKRRRYRAMGVREYWLFDPKGDVYPQGEPRLQGFELADGEYHALESRLVAGERVIRSEVLGLDVRVDGELLRFQDATAGRNVRHRPEVEADEKRAQAAAERAQAAAEGAESRAERAENRAERAENRVAELEAALRRLREDHRT